VRPTRTGPTQVEIITVGRELLRGRIVDGNGPRLARYFTQQGALVRRITTVDDRERSIAAAVREALDRNPNLVVTTGGLGPTDDDRTLEGVGGALELPLTLSQEARAMIEAGYIRLRERKLVSDSGLTREREKMCMIPVGAEPVLNPVGVSPGVLVRIVGGATVLCLPGMPDEVDAVLEKAMEHVKIAPGRELAHREIEAPTADESALRPLLDRLTSEFPRVWISCHRRRSQSKIMIRIETSGENLEETETALNAVVKRLLALAAGGP